MSPTAHSRSPARMCSSTSTVSASGSSPTVSSPDVGEVGAAAGRDQQLVGVEHLARRRARGTRRRGRPARSRRRRGRRCPRRAAPRSARARPPAPRARRSGPPPRAASPARRTARRPGPAPARSARRRPRPAARGPRSPSSPRGWSSTASPSSPSIGSRSGSVPVLSSTPRAARSTVVPPSSSTRTTPGPSSRPWPRTIRTPACSSGSTCWWSVQSWLASRIRAATSDQSGRTVASPASRSARCTSATRSAGRTISLEGVQPQNGHSPPTSASSTPTTSSPASASLRAAYSPPGPSTEHHHVTVLCRLSRAHGATQPLQPRWAVTSRPDAPCSAPTEAYATSYVRLGPSIATNPDQVDPAIEAVSSPSEPAQRPGGGAVAAHAVHAGARRGGRRAQVDARDAGRVGVRRQPRAGPTSWRRSLAPPAMSPPM